MKTKMKTTINFSNIARITLMLSFFTFASGCNKKDSINSTLTLAAQQSDIAAGGTTKITATVSNSWQCCNLMYQWSASSGNINGSGTEITYTASAGLGQHTITCIAKDNCGKISQSESIMLTVH